MIHPEHQDDPGLQEEHVGVIIGALAALILLLFAIAVFIILRQQRKKQEEDAAYGPYDKHNMTNLDEYKITAGTNAMLASYHMYNAIAMSEVDYGDDSLKKNKLKDTYSEPSEKGSNGKLKTPDSPGKLADISALCVAGKVFFLAVILLCQTFIVRKTIVLYWVNFQHPHQPLFSKLSDLLFVLYFNPQLS